MALVCTMGCNNPNAKLSSNNDNLGEKIIGLWGGLEENEPVWKITPDSIYYFSEQKSYSYKLYRDSLEVNYKEGPFYLWNLSVIQDTLIFFDYLGIKTFAYRKRK